jgi:hypothetical protein
MNKVKRLEWISVVFVVLFLFVSLPQSQGADATATVPLTATAVVGAAETESPYTLTFKLAAVALHREDNKSQELFYATSFATHAQVDTGDLDLGWAPGMDASIMLQNPCYGIELRYLGLTQWSETKSDSEIDPFWGDESAVSGKFKSRLHNAELNLHWWPCANDRYSWLVGFRWFRLTDRLSGSEDQYDGLLGYYYYGQGSLSSRNELWGGQVGIEGLLFGKRDKGFSVDGGVKAGVFANKIRNKVSESYEEYYGGYSNGSYSDSWNRTKTAFLSEVVLNANYAFTKNISMTVGYQFLYVNKVAVPINNWGSTQSVIFHGGRMGLNVAF